MVFRITKKVTKIFKNLHSVSNSLQIYSDLEPNCGTMNPPKVFFGGFLHEQMTDEVLFLFFRSAGLSRLIEEGLHSRVLVGELSDGQILCLVKSQTEIVL